MDLAKITIIFIFTTTIKTFCESTTERIDIIENNGLRQFVVQLNCTNNEECTQILNRLNETINSANLPPNIITDFDECRQIKSPCPENTFCKSNKYSYNCFCIEGYETVVHDHGLPSDVECRDIDECQDSKTCPLKTTICKNIPGSYACECLPEYDGYGSDCTEAPRLFNSSTQFQTTPTVPLRTDYTTFVTTTNQTTATHMPNVTLSNNEESSFKNGLTKSAFSTSITKNFTSSQTSTMYKEKNETTSYILNGTIKLQQQHLQQHLKIHQQQQH